MWLLKFDKKRSKENPTPVILIAPKFFGGVSIYLSLCIAYSEYEITAHNGRTSNSQFLWPSFTTFLPVDLLSFHRTRTLSQEKSHFRIISSVCDIPHAAISSRIEHWKKHIAMQATCIGFANDRSPNVKFDDVKEYFISISLAKILKKRKISRDIFGSS